MKKEKKIIIYQTKSGAVELKGNPEKENIWATQDQITEIFEIDQSVVSRHIKKIFKQGEIKPKSNMQKMHIPNSDKPVNLYSLDVILAVGYRTNSARAIKFRQWATKTLREHLTQGYTLNRKRLSKNYTKFLQAVDQLKILLPSSDRADAENVLELTKLFASTWFSLDAYDKAELPNQGLLKKQVHFTAKELSKDLLKLKKELIKKKEATELFGAERKSQSLKGIVGNIFQSFDGQDLYPTVEEKAAHLLYFIVKNHPFTDGNKRSGAFAFVWFLNKTGLLRRNEISPQALTVLTLLVAESDPTNKGQITGLILLLLKK